MEIRALDLSDPELHKPGDRLMAEAFGDQFSWSNVVEDLEIRASRRPLALGAFDDEGLAGVNGFVAHDLIHDGEFVPAYQSCWTAVAQRTRGRGTFGALIEAAKERFLDRGEAFLFGFPNHRSGPIMRTKLNFRDHGGFFRVRAPRGLVRSVFRSWDDREALVNRYCYLQNDAQLMELKRRKLGGLFIEASDGGNVIWGRRRSRQVGPGQASVFDVGGMIVNAPHRFPDLVEDALAANGCHLAMFAIHQSSPWMRMFSRYDVALTEHLLVHPLQREVARNAEFHFLIGVKDVF